MRAVTESAGLRLYGIISVSLFKALFSLLMTGKAKRDSCLFQKSLLVRTVGKMTGLATAVLNDFMYNLLLVVFFIVAVITGLVALGLEKMAGLRGMRVMAERTFSHFNRRVHLGPVNPDLLFAVAGIADFIPGILEEELGHSSMSQMAFLAFLLFYNRMHIFHAHIPVTECRMTVKAFLAHKLLLGEGCIVRQVKGNSAKESHHSRKHFFSGRTVYAHFISSLIRNPGGKSLRLRTR
jgi:hypothetical protein